MTKIKSIKHTTKNFELLYDIAVEVSKLVINKNGSAHGDNPSSIGELKFLANDALQKLNNKKQ
tara:strand:+ start:2204 stop:2392 length:189 start_codon:yes stop_codon:yes gene_type:complete